MIPEIIEKTVWSVLVSLGFALLFNTPKRALWAVALLGALGFGLKITLLHTVLEGKVIVASFIGASAVGLSGVYFAHRVHTPPIVFTVPAVINMIPGTFGYQFIIGLLKIVNFENAENESFATFIRIINDGLKAGFILMALAMGIIFPILIFNAKTVKDKDLHRLIEKKVVRRVRVVRYKRKKR